MMNITKIALAIDSTDAVKARSNLDAMQASGIKTESTIRTIGKALSGLAVGAAAVKGITSALQASAKYEMGLLGVSKTTNLVGKDLDMFSGKIQKIAQQIPVSTAELLDLAKAAGQMGVTGSDNLEKFAVTIAKLGRTSDLAGEEAATSLARILNVTGESVDSIDTLASVLVVLGNNVAATESEIAHMTNEVSRSTAAFGVSSAEAASMGAAMAALGIKAESGGSSVGRVMQEITSRVLTGGKALDDFSKAFNIDPEKLTALFNENKTEAFLYFLEEAGKLGLNAGTSLDNFGLGGQEVLKTIIPLAQNVEIFHKTLKLATDEVKNATALNKEYDATAEALDSQYKKSINNVYAYATAIGFELMPAAKSVLTIFNEWASNDGVEKAVNATTSAVEILSIALGARLVGAIGASAAQLALSAVAAHENAIAMRASAAQGVMSAQADVQRASASVAATQAVIAQLVAERELEVVRMQSQISAKGRMMSATRLAEINVAQASITRTLATEEAVLTKARAGSVTALNAQSAASVRATVASSALSAASRGASAALAMVGGPLGAAVIAAGAVYYFREELGFVAPDAEKATASVNKFISSLENLTSAQTELDLKDKLLPQLESAKDQLEIYRQQIENLNDGLKSQPGYKVMEDLLVSARANFDTTQQAVIQFSTAVEKAQEKISGFDSLGFSAKMGDPFAVTDLPTEKEKTSPLVAVTDPNARSESATAMLVEIELMKQQQDLIRSGMTVKQAEAEIEAKRTQSRLESEGLTRNEIAAYMELQKYTSSAAQAESIQKEIDLLDYKNSLIENGLSIKEVDQALEDEKIEQSMRSQGATQAQIDEMIRLQTAIREAGEQSKSMDMLNESLNRIREKTDPMSELTKELEKLKLIFDAGLLGEGDLGEDEFEKLSDGLKSVYEEGEKLDEVFSDIGKTIDNMSGGTIKSLKTMQRVFESGTKGYAALEVAIQAANAAQAINAVINQSMGDPYTAFARMAAMIAAMASLGQSVGSLGGSFTDTAAERQSTQGTGTVFGDWDAKSESIANATEITADATKELVGINRGMLNALSNLKLGISGATNSISRGSRNSAFDYGGSIDVSETPITDLMKNGFVGSALTELPLASLFSMVDKWFGGSSKVTDQGIKIIGGTLSEMIDDVMLQSYQETQYKKYSFGSRHTRTAFSDIGEDQQNQFSLIFQSIADSVSQGAQAIGMSAADVDKAISSFEIATQFISLKDLSAEDQQAEIEAVFSSIFDNLAGSVIPFVDQFQRVGEGLGETLARVATNIQVVDEAIYRLGFNAENLGAEQFSGLSTALIDVAGGMESFISGMNSFIDKFADESHKFDISQTDMTKAMERVGLAVPETRQGLWDLMQTLDANTDSGRNQIAALLSLSGTADEYYNKLESREASEAKSAEKAMRDAEQQKNLAIKAVEDISRSLQTELNQIKTASGDLGSSLSGNNGRDEAMELLRNALTSGDFTGTGQAAQTAANIDQNSFSTLEDFRAEQARTFSLLSALEREGAQQLSNADESLMVLQNIDAGILSVSTSIDSLSEAIRMGTPIEVVGTSAPGNLDTIQTVSDEQDSILLLAELKEMVAYLKQTAKNTGESAEYIQRWDIDGLPLEREEY